MGQVDRPLRPCTSRVSPVPAFQQRRRCNSDADKGLRWTLVLPRKRREMGTEAQAVDAKVNSIPSLN